MVSDRVAICLQALPILQWAALTELALFLCRKWEVSLEEQRAWPHCCNMSAIDHYGHHFANPKMNDGPIRAVLGDETPELEPTALGRLRLLGALERKFGANYRNKPGVPQALSHFDKELSYFQKIRRIRAGGR